MKLSFWWSAAFVCLVASAQTDTGSLSGRITDPSGSGVPNAVVKLRNRATTAQRETTTTQEGTYQLNLLPPGLYEVTVEANGFKRFVDPAARIAVAQPALLNATLTLGNVSESVEVVGAASLLNTESMAQGTVISEEKIVSLPLNGRQFIDLALLVPGTNAGGRNVQQNNVRLNQTGGFSSSGGRTNNNLFLFDGAVNTDPDYNALSYVPIVDSLAEFQVQTAQFSAQYGRASGSQINVVSKSGSNAYHGTAWEFLRNQKMDARPFNSVTPTLPKNQRNQFGAAIGGPVLRNKLFFFAAAEFLRLRQAGVGITTVVVPTALEKQGNFSATPAAQLPYDPDTLSGGVRSLFPGNVIPANRLNPVTRAALAAMPDANIGANRYVNGNAVLQQNVANGSGRIDWVMTSKTNVLGRYSLSREDSVIPDVVPNRDRLGDVRPQNFALGVTTVLSARMVNEVRLGLNRLYFLDGLPEPLFEVNGQRQNIPRFRPSGYPVMGGAGAFTGTTGGGTVLARNTTYQIYDNFSWTRGRVNWKFGGEILRLNYVRSEAASPLGDFQFLTGYTSRTAANDNTGNALATMLLALPNQGNRQITPTRIDGQQYAGALYAQSDIRLSSRLTLNLGVRYELAPPISDTRRQIASIDYRKVPWPTEIFATGRTGFFQPTLFTCGLGGYPAGCAYTDKNNWSPRVGLVWNVLPKTVIRAGGGIFYALTDNNGFLQLARGLPTNVSQNLNAASNFVPSFRNFEIFGSATDVGRVALSQAGLDLFQRTSYSPQVSFSVQRELTRHTVVEASYLGTFGIKLQQNVQPNNARPGPGAVDPRRPYAGVLFDSGMVFPPYIRLVANNVPVTQVNLYAQSAQSNYHALLLRFERRFSGGFSWLSSYTWSKAITNAPQFRNAGGANGSENSPPQDSYNLRAERGLASFDLRARFVNTMVWELPFGKNKRYLTQGPAAAILGGWQLSTIWQAQTGFPFTINVNGDTAGIGGGTGGILVRANAVPGVTADLAPQQRSTSRWFNPVAFSLPPAFTFGNVGRNTVAGPGLVNVDATLSRTITFRERYGLQLRGEFFNLMNKPNYRLVGRLINVPDTFARVLNQADPRQIQVAAKFTF
jgi:hypothetical protein